MEGKSGGRLELRAFEEDEEEDGAVRREGAVEGKNQSRFDGGRAASPSKDILGKKQITGGALWEFKL